MLLITNSHEKQINAITLNSLRATAKYMQHIREDILHCDFGNKNLVHYNHLHELILLSKLPPRKTNGENQTDFCKP